MKQALCFCLFLFATVASGQQSSAVNVSNDPLYDKEPVIVVDESTTPPTLITAWMSFTEDGSQFYVRTAWSRGDGRSPGKIPENANSEKFLALKRKPDGSILRNADGSAVTYRNSGDPIFGIGPNNEIYLITVSCDDNRCQSDTDISLWKSTNHGETWTDESLCPQAWPVSVDKPSIAVSNNNNLYVAHLLFNPSAIHVHRRMGGVWDTKTINVGANDSPGSPIVVLDETDGVETVYVVWLARGLHSIYVSYSVSFPGGLLSFQAPISTDIGQFSACLNGCNTQTVNGQCGTASMDATSNLMASYNALTKSIAIVWHAPEGDSATNSDMKFISFSTQGVKKGFVGTHPVTIEAADSSSSHPDNQWTPGIECDPYGRCLVTYYQSIEKSIECSTTDARNSLKFRPHATLVDAEGRTLVDANVGTLAGWNITDQVSDPKEYRPRDYTPSPGYPSDPGMGEYQGVYYSAGKWYNAFIQVPTTGRGDVYVAELDVPCTTTVWTTSLLPVPASGGSLSFNVNVAPEGCTTWTPASDSPWAYIDNTAPRNTSGGFNVAVQANTGAQRQATITVAGKSIVITQQAQGCATLPRRVAVAPGLASGTDRPIATTVGGGSEGPLFYDWYERLPGETTPRLYYKHTSYIYVTPSQPLTYYSAVVRNSCGQSVSLAEVPIYLCVPTIKTQPVADQFVPRGASTNLTIVASPAIVGQPVTITWRSYDTGQIVGSGPTLSVTPAPGTMQTYLAYVSTDCSGIPFSMQSQAATVRGCELAATAYGDRTITLGQSAPLSSSISGTQVLPSDAEYTWYYGPAPGTEYASGVGLWAITPTPQSTTTYWVRVKDGTCTADSNTVTVRISAPRDAQVLSQSVPATMNARRSYTVSTTLKNVGTQSWSPVGPSPQCNVFRLGSINPQDNVNWGRLRADLPATVAPGGQVTVTFPVTAPEAPGTYNFQWKMLQECVTWFGDSTPNVAVNVQPAPPRDTQVLSQSVPATMTAGQVYPVSVTLKNVGTETWSPVGVSPQCNVYRLGSANPQDNLIWGRMRADLPATVAPGGLVTINFNVTAPSTPGTYNFQWRMLQECVTWFGDSTPNVVVTVNP